MTVTHKTFISPRLEKSSGIHSRSILPLKVTHKPKLNKILNLISFDSILLSFKNVMIYCGFRNASI